MSSLVDIVEKGETEFHLINSDSSDSVADAIRSKDNDIFILKFNPQRCSGNGRSTKFEDWKL